MRDVRGRDIAMIFQEPMTSLNPVHDHRRPDRRRHQPASHRPRPHAQALHPRGSNCSSPGRHPGSRPPPRQPTRTSSRAGMRQRAMIAMALSCDPDHPDCRRTDDGLGRHHPGADSGPAGKGCSSRRGMSMIFITHNLGVVAEIADRVLVMYGGRLVEQEAEVHPLFAQPLMPYTDRIAELRATPGFFLRDVAASGLQAIPRQRVPDPLRHASAAAASHPRCADRIPARPLHRCRYSAELEQVAEAARQVRCVRWREVAA